MVFLFRSEKNVRTTRELEYYFFCRAKREIFFPEINIRLYDKNSESNYFFFLHQNHNIICSNIGNQNIFLEKKPQPPPPWKLNGPSLMFAFRIAMENTILSINKMGEIYILYCWNSSKFQQKNRRSIGKIDPLIHIYITAHFPGLVK